MPDKPPCFVPESGLAAPSVAAKQRSLVPLAGIEPALLAELDFESSASTSSATGAFVRPTLRGNRAKPAEYSGRPSAVNPRGSECGAARQALGRGIRPFPDQGA